jgi:hypothetical protein
VKTWKTNLYDWFTNKGKIKAKFVHVTELDTQIETKKKNLPILENHPILKDSIVAMLQKMKEASQPLAISIVEPIFRGMIESLAPNVLCDNKVGGFEVIR